MSDHDAVERMLDDIRRCRMAGDLDGLMALFDDDARFRVVGFGDPAIGKAQVRSTLESLIAQFHFVEYRPIKTLSTATTCRCGTD